MRVGSAGAAGRWPLAALEGIADHAAADNPAAAYRLVVALTKRAGALLSISPMAGRVGRARGTRDLVLADLPYIIAYRVTDRVEILAVVRGAREWPKLLESRRICGAALLCKPALVPGFDSGPTFVPGQQRAPLICEWGL